MLVWLITRDCYQALDGEGARLNGGRWNSEGVPVVYTSATLALAALEYLVHVDVGDAPADLVAMRIRVPDDLPEQRIRTSDLPPAWNRIPDHPACVKRGNAWAREAGTAILRVPSALVPEEENLLLNPRHAEAGRITVESVRPFGFDPRLLG